MKKSLWAMLFLVGLAAVGCAQKTETEKLADQLEKAGKEWERESNKAVKDLTAETKRVSEKLNREMESVQ